MRYNLCVFLLAVFILNSCDQSNSGENSKSSEINQPIEVIDKGIKSFPIDDETNFEGLVDLKLTSLEGQEYLSFYSKEANSIYMYNYENAEVFRRIQLEKTGPNSIRQFFTFQYFFHDMDSIFINIPLMGQYMINQKAEVVDKLVSGGRGISMDEVRNVGYDQASYFNNGQVNTLLGGQFNNKTKDAYFRATVDWSSDSITSKSIPSKELFPNYAEIVEVMNTSDKTYFGIETIFLRGTQFLIGSTPISDSVFVFKENIKSGAIYVGSPNHSIADFETYLNLKEVKMVRSGSSGSISNVVEPVQPAYYGDITISPDGKYLYRVLSHGTKAVYNELLKQDRPEVIGATLIVVNIATEQISYFDLPVDEIQVSVPVSTNVFTSSAGIHFRVKDQDNENEIQFRVFGVK